MSRLINTLPRSMIYLFRIQTSFSRYAQIFNIFIIFQFIKEIFSLWQVILKTVLRISILHVRISVTVHNTYNMAEGRKFVITSICISVMVYS